MDAKLQDFLPRPQILRLVRQNLGRHVGGQNQMRFTEKLHLLETKQPTKSTKQLAQWYKRCFSLWAMPEHIPKRTWTFIPLNRFHREHARWRYDWNLYSKNLQSELTICRTDCQQKRPDRPQTAAEKSGVFSSLYAICRWTFRRTFWNITNHRRVITTLAKLGVHCQLHIRAANGISCISIFNKIKWT